MCNVFTVSPRRVYNVSVARVLLVNKSPQKMHTPECSHHLYAYAVRIGRAGRDR